MFGFTVTRSAVLIKLVYQWLEGATREVTCGDWLVTSGGGGRAEGGEAASGECREERPLTEARGSRRF